MITVTGASGHLGRLAIEALLDRGVAAGDVTAVARTAAKAASLGARVRVRHGDYSKPETLADALAGTTTLVLVSSSEVGQRAAQHANVINAAVAAGVSRILYTSFLNADTTGAALADEHKATEAAIRASGLAYTLLRNGWYTENYTENLAPAFQSGTLYGAAGEGRVAAATRADYAAAIAVAATGPGHDGKAYELAGDKPFTMTELAAEVSAQSGRQITYTSLPAEEYAKALIQAGLPEPYAAILADSDLAVERGDLTTTSTDLRELIGRPTTSLADAVAQALKG